MFGGLEIKAPVAEKPKEDDPSVKAASSSAFSFMSSNGATNGSDTTPASASISDAPSKEEPVKSGFGFMATGTTPTASSAIGVTASESSGGDEKVGSAESGTSYSAPEPASSGFSFLGASANTNNNQSEATSIKSNAAETPIPSDATPAQNGSNTTTESSSIFSMLNMSSGHNPSTNASQPGKSHVNSTTKTTASNDDILSLQNPSQPAGSGMVFGGAITKKTKPVIKKRPKKKKVGTGIGGDVNVIAPGVNMTSLPDSPVQETSIIPQGEPNTASMKNEPSDTTVEVTQSSTLKTEAEEAATRAEQFMMKKQTEERNNPPHIVSGRYGSQSVEEDYGDTSSSFVPPTITPSQTSTDDEDYSKAKAAAEEAQQRPQQGGKIGGIFKGFLQTMNMVNAANEKHAANLANNSVHSSRGSNPRDSPAPVESNQIGANAAPAENNFKVILKESSTNEQQKPEKLEVERREREKRDALAEVQDRLEKARKDEEERKRVNHLKEQKRRELENEQRIQEAHAKLLQSPENVFRHILDRFAEKTTGATNRVVQLRNERASLVHKRSLAEKQERLATQQISQAETQQTEAIEHEDFELADHLAAVIERHQKEKDVQAKTLDDIETTIDALDSKRLDVVRHLTLCFVDIQDSLREFSDNQVAKEADDGNEIMDKFAEESKRLAAENDRLQDDLKHIERDEEYLSNEKEDLSKNIEEQTADVESMKDKASTKLALVNEEVEKLRQQLKEKLAEAASIQEEVDNHERSIFMVRNQFSRQLTRLSKKEDSAKEIRSEWESENEAYQKMRIEHDEKVAAHSEAMVRHQELKDRVKSEIKTAEALAKIVTKEVVVEMQGDSIGNDSDDLLTMQAEVVTCEALADESNQVLMTAKANIDKLRDEISGIDDLIPTLETQKKTAASSRDFKAAAKASKEIKEMSARKAFCEDELDGEAAERLRIAQTDLEKCLEDLKEKKSITHEKEKKHGFERMSQLVKKIKKLESIKDKMCGKEGDCPTNHSVSSIGVFVLDGEISHLKKEGQELGDKYGQWEALMDLQDGDNDVEDVITGSSEGLKSTSIDNASETEVADEPKLNEESECATPEMTKEDAIKRYNEIMIELKDIENDLNDAVEKEEYEEAAELDTKLESLKSELESLGIADEDLAMHPEVSDSEEIEGKDDMADEDTNHDVSEQDEQPPSSTDNKTEDESNEEGNDQVHSANDEIEDESAMQSEMVDTEQRPTEESECDVEEDSCKNEDAVTDDVSV